MVGLLDRLFGSGAGDALRAPYSLEDPDELHDLLASDFEDVDVREMEGVARFDSIDDWVHTDIRGWTLSDLSDTDYETLLGAARTDLVQYVQADDSVAFSAPALIAVGTASS
ncbi:MAG TPA: hypothetical protein VMS99_15010 [Acidimicrobiia bacterium]|nr:hypothetical protein [Acidimicrobiia bacterium]